jgi:hypothetical protein
MPATPPATNLTAGASYAYLVREAIMQRIYEFTFRAGIFPAHYYLVVNFTATVQLIIYNVKIRF